MFRQAITIFQAQKLNLSLLNKLNSYNIKVVLKDKPCYQDYKMIHNSFLHIHPDNLSILVASYPELFKASHQNSKMYLNDLNMVSAGEFNRLKFNGPLVFDANNNLLANNDLTISRLLSNHDPMAHNHINLHNLVHPHRAEFADLF
ncbi:hypothetical protein PSN45_005158 [Yamadazyma tenuis]|uniref:Uncharacterized protein n=1 Tax=Candida tenuis (strain ATCC 10573 / BCRC 21748 / CBS 615 / JCM 9827 / NBRC 10315 / NRRL Y-1498 / VKM Y-70) TaxID=590646 RepID=G3B0U8_CANTC|nr:uncharacterized protein CANTEDRAFT_93045 [Yamadazyma tenuis ATCC 10573]EGV64807.1 hypothetical protein CANTEDRAFT_93045 [Yamadazyma tenuis ATCC 10573]WEJ97602.1 hypothetical protein PSN45_005158 [Yamadazyma tenuis]